MPGLVIHACRLGLVRRITQNKAVIRRMLGQPLGRCCLREARVLCRVVFRNDVQAQARIVIRRTGRRGVVDGLCLCIRLGKAALHQGFDTGVPKLLLARDAAVAVGRLQFDAGGGRIVHHLPQSLRDARVYYSLSHGRRLGHREITGQHAAAVGQHHIPLVPRDGFHRGRGGCVRRRAVCRLGCAGRYGARGPGRHVSVLPAKEHKVKDDEQRDEHDARPGKNRFVRYSAPGRAGTPAWRTAAAGA